MLKKLTASLSALLLLLLPLASAVPVNALATNPIVNPTLQGGVTNPDSSIALSGWSHNDWMDPAGAFTPSYQYVTDDGHGDNTSVKVSITGYDKVYTPSPDGQGGSLTGDLGDGKWIFSPLGVTSGTPTAGAPLEIGKQYRFTAWYKSNVVPKIVADYIDATGTKETFFGMPNPVAASPNGWTKYSETFSIPQGTAAVTVFMFLDQNGWLQTDDYSIEDYTPTGWNEPLLSLTFDDGHEDNVTNLLPLLTQYGYKSTQCFETGTLLANPSQATTNVGAFLNAGHEICSHTITHPMLSQIYGQNDTQLNRELVDSKSYLQSIVGDKQQIEDFASPYGDYDQHVIDAIKAAGYASHRTVDEGFNSKDNFDPYRLRVQNIFDTTTASQIAAWVAQAKADNTWLILVYHRVVDTSKAGQAGYEAPGPYDTALDMMKQHLDAIQASGIKVATLQSALAEVKAQLTPTPPADTTPPVISAAVDPNGNPPYISWGANEPVKDVTIEYGTTTAYGLSAVTTPLGDMNIAALKDAKAYTKYYFRITASDQAGNIGVYTGEFTSGNVSVPVPVFSNVSTGNPSIFSATTSWDTDVLTTTTYEYGTSTSYGSVITDQNASLTHFALLGPLLPNTTYYFKITATNPSTSQSSTYTGQFKTQPAPVVGDLNADGKVGLNDLSILSSNWNSTSAAPYQGDLNGDGKVNLNDLSILSNNWSK